ncbi:MAG: flagellar protein FlaG [Clostridiales bacterium]|jgi:uncharacterized FlaG/YvyC family protein|nr:flagellar protein FlaG [Clostridiales bacterium]
MDVSSIGAMTYEAPVAMPQAAPAPQPQVVESVGAPSVEVSAQNGGGNIQAGQPGQPTEKEQPSTEEVSKTIEQINKSLAVFNREMHISVHSKVNRLMIKVMDTKENKVIREIPPEKVLDAFARTLELAGILMDTKR